MQNDLSALVHFHMAVIQPHFIIHTMAMLPSFFCCRTDLSPVQLNQGRSRYSADIQKLYVDLKLALGIQNYLPYFSPTQYKGRPSQFIISVNGFSLKPNSLVGYNIIQMGIEFRKSLVSLSSWVPCTSRLCIENVGKLCAYPEGRQLPYLIF